MIILRTANFVSTELIFSYIQLSLPNFAFSRAKSPSVTYRSVSNENAYKKSKHPSPFLKKTIGSNNSFTLIENKLRFSRYLSFNSM